MEKKYFIVPVVLFIAFIAIFLYTNKQMARQMSAVNQNLKNKTNPTTANSGQNPENTQVAPTIANNSYQSSLSLVISSPQDGATVATSSINITGKTSPGADVFVNEKQLKADTSGNFSTAVTLDEGQNVFAVVANDANGNSAEKQVAVNLESTQ